MTIKQDEARKRNWQIKQLRGCWAIINSLPIRDINKQLALGAIDEILKELGAETELVHRETVYQQLQAKWVKEEETTSSK